MFKFITEKFELTLYSSKNRVDKKPNKKKN